MRSSSPGKILGKEKRKKKKQKGKNNKEGSKVMVVEFRAFGGHRASSYEQKNLYFVLRHLGNPYHPITNINNYFNPNYSEKLYHEIIQAVESPVDKVVVHGTTHFDPLKTHVYITIGFEPYLYHPHPCPDIDYKELVPFSRYHIVLGYVV